MKRTTLSWLSISVVAAGMLAGCGMNPGVTGTQLKAQSTQPLVMDGNGAARRFGYTFTGGHRRLSPIGFTFGATERALPAKVDLRTGGKISPIYDQGDLGSCTAFAMGLGLRETMANMAGQPANRLSALYMYYKERELRGSVDEDTGAYMIDGMQVLKANGDCLETTQPYITSNFKQKPTAKAETEAAAYKIADYTLLNNLDEMKAQLAAGRPAVFGFMVYNSFMTPAVAKTGKMPMPKPSEQVIGGHAVFIVGYDDAQKVLIIKNSWGSGWGDKGYFYMPYAYVTPDKVDEIYVAK